MEMSVNANYAEEIEAIEAILSKANLLLREIEDQEKNHRHNANMQAFVNILEDMKNKLITMIQSYENDNLLSKLLELNDGIDQVVSRLTADPTLPVEASDLVNNDLTFSRTSLLLDEYDGSILEEIALDFEGEVKDRNSLKYLIPSPPSDGASSSSSHTKKKKEKKDKKEKEDKKGKMAAKVTCKICDDEYDSWYLVHELASCSHIYCIECLRQYYMQRIKDGSVLHISCPDPACKEEVTPNDVRCVLDQATWEKYDNFVLMSALKQDPNICWCPFPGCTNAIYREPGEDPKIICDACKFQFCAECKEAWHGDMSCEEYASIKEKMEKSVAKQAPSFNVWTSKHSKQVKPCPGCKGFIEKFDGCNHMTCVNCKYQFCWMCLSEYTGMHFNDNINFPNCYMKQYYSPRPWYKPHVEKETLVKAGKILGIGAAVVILGVPVAVIGGPIYGCIKLRQKLRPKKWVITNHGWELHNV
eukprot:Phypoly_transcript_04324.p1 GENE.Phypoly_transcript_04324~~Phypoly_transcript_04324.p1  ORF type:complete len:473 (+),score=85.85 Phypoly_transcript_04324:456-1874(+)